MRRPIVFILLTYVSGITAGFVFKGEGLMPIGGLVLILIMFLTVAPSIKQGWLQPFLCVFFLGCLYFNLYSSNSDAFKQLENKQVTVTGYVVSAQKQYEDYYKIELTGEAYYFGNQGRNFNERLLVNLKGSLDYIDLSTSNNSSISKDSNLVYADLVGRPVRLTGIVTRPPSVKNPHLFDYKLYLKTRNINTIIEAKSWQCSILPGKVKVQTNLLALYKYGLMEKMNKNMSPESFGLMAGILFGDKNFIDDSTYQAFQKNGAAHILSVSGIHVGIIYAFIDKMVGKGRHPLYNGISIGILLVYAALSGFSPSVDRAVFMIIIFIAAKFLNERYDLTTCTAFSAFVLLLYNPYNILNLGFQLSYLAVFILAVILPWLTKFRDKLTAIKKEETVTSLETQKKETLRNKAVQLVLPLIAIQIGMIPITAYIFNYFSLSAFVVNTPVIMLAGIILPIGILLMIIGLILALCGNPILISGGISVVILEIERILYFLFSLLSTAAELLIQIMIELNKFAAVRGIGYFNIENPSLITVFVYYVILFLGCSELGQWYFEKSRMLEDNPQRKKEKIIVVIILTLILMASIIFVHDDYDQAELVFIDVGQGDCLHIKTPSGKNILIDGGGSRDLSSGGSGYDVGNKTLLPYLLKNGVSKIDVAIVSHVHEDHFKGLASLSQAMKIGKLVLYSGNQDKQKELMSSLDVDENKLVYVQKGDRINLEPGIFIDVLYPDYIKNKGASDLGATDGFADENSMNLLLRLNYYGFTVMMTGDLTGEDEMKMIKEGLNLKADILKVPHHGSRYSSTEAFIDSVDPACAIIQVGKNNFGHPNPEIVENYEKKGIMVFRTDRDGAVLIDIKQENYFGLMTMLDQHWKNIGI